MESYNYDSGNRNFIDTLARMTYDVLHQTKAPQHRGAERTSRRGWFDRLDTWFWKQDLASREAFLAKANDIVELEQRMRWLERGRC